MENNECDIIIRETTRVKRELLLKLLAGLIVLFLGCDTEQRTFSYSISQLDIMFFRLDIYQDNELHQQIDFESTFKIDETWIDLTDCNQDGYNDICIPREGGSGGQMYNIWLYQAVKKKFIFHDELSSLVSPSIDSTTHKICTFWRGGDTEQRDTFELVGNKLVQLKFNGGSSMER